MTTPTAFEHKELEQALFYIEDIMDRALCQFFVLGETAEQVRNDSLLNLDKIVVGIKKNEFIGARSLLHIVLPDVEFNEDTKKLNLEFKGVPIEIRIIQKKWDFLKDLDRTFYGVTQFWLPNPFSKYWKVKQLV